MTLATPRPLATARLALRPLAAEDAPALFPMFSSGEAMRYWHTAPHRDAGRTAAVIGNMIGMPGSCWWAICLQGEALPCGVVGYHGSSAFPGMGYALHPAHQRQGLAREAVSATLAEGFDALGLERVELWIHEGNVASRRLAERVGFSARGRFRQRYPDNVPAGDTLVYGLTAQEWGATHAPSRVDVFGGEPILPVADVARSVAYYRDQLGFAVEYALGEPPTHVGLVRGSWTTQAARLPLTQSSAAPPPGLEFYLRIGPGLDQLYAELKAHGATIVREPVEQPWGVREFAVRDLDGYVLRFASPA